MFGQGHGGWGLAPVIHGLDLIIGSIVQRPAVVEGRIEPRMILNLTLVFDHLERDIGGQEWFRSALARPGCDHEAAHLTSSFPLLQTGVFYFSTVYAKSDVRVAGG